MIAPVKKGKNTSSAVDSTLAGASTQSSPLNTIAKTTCETNVSSVYWLRFICCLLIFFLHYCKRLGHEELNWYFQLAVPCFLFVSAYLYGIRPKGTSNFDKRFLFNRWKALSYVYYPFLICVFIFELITIENYGISYTELAKRFLICLLFQTNYGYYLPDCGHLWFLQRLMECYIILFVLDKTTSLRSLLQKKILPNIILIVFILLSGLLYRGLGPVHYLFYVLIFIHSKKINKLAIKMKLHLFILMGGFGYIGLFLNYKDSFHYGIYLWYFNICLLGLLLLCFFIKYFSNVKVPSIVKYGAGISLEFYLIHALFIYRFPLAISFTLSVVAAILLNKLSQILKGA